MARNLKVNEDVYGLAILDSGNYALRLLKHIEKYKLYFEFMSVPCKIAKFGCGYCIKFPLNYCELLIKEGKKIGLPIKTIYEVKPVFLKNKYKIIYTG